ncbi:hypothetical protein D3C73_695380 [compost metagenome]
MVKVIDIDHLAPGRFGFSQGLGFHRLQYTSLEGGIDHRLAGHRFDLATFECHMQFFLQRLCGAQQIAGVLQCTDRIVARLRAVAPQEHFLQCRVALGAADHPCDFGAEFVRWPFVPAPEREHDHSQQTAHDFVREVAQQFIHRPFRLAQAFFHGPGQQWCHVLR